MNTNTIIPKIWFGFNGLIDVNKNETGLCRSKAKLFTYSISTVFGKELSTLFDEIFKEEENHYIEFEEFERFMIDNLLSEEIEPSEETDSKKPIDIDRKIFISSNEKHQLVENRLSDACWALCKKAQVNKETLELLGDNVCFTFWNIFIISAMINEETGKTIVPVTVDLDELKFIFSLLLNELGYDIGMKRAIKEKVELLVTKAMNKLNEQNGDEDVNCLEKPIDFPTSLEIFNELIHDITINSYVVLKIFQNYLKSLQLGFIKQGIVLKNKEHQSKANNSPSKHVLCQVYPGLILLGDDEKTDEKKLCFNLHSDSLIESFALKEKSKFIYRIRVVDNKRPLFMFEFHDSNEQTKWIGAMNHAIKLYQEGIEFPTLQECRERESKRREKRQKKNQEKNSWLALSEESSRFREEASKEIRSLKSEISKLERQNHQWEEEKDAAVKKFMEIEKNLERRDFEMNLLSEQVERLKKLNEKLQVDLVEIKIETLDTLERNEDLVSSPELAARLESELVNLERMTMQFEEFKKQKDEQIAELEKKLDKGSEETTTKTDLEEK